MIALTVANFKSICGKVDALQLSNRDDTIIEGCLDRSKIKIESYFIQSSKSYSETDDGTSAVIMYYAIYLLYQRANISKKAEKWRNEAFEILGSILGQIIAEDYQDRDKKAITYVAVAKQSDDEDWLTGY